MMEPNKVVISVKCVGSELIYCVIVYIVISHFRVGKCPENECWFAGGVSTLWKHVSRRLFLYLCIVSSGLEFGFYSQEME